jgi:hypothetical protein
MIWSTAMWTRWQRRCRFLSTGVFDGRTTKHFRHMGETITKAPRKRAKGSPRIGRVAGGKGEPARFVEGGEPPARPGFDPERIVEELGMWWKSGGGSNFILGAAGQGWAVWPEQGIIDLMREAHCVAIKAREDERLSESKRVFLWARVNRCLDEIFPALAGYSSGVHLLPSGERVLVKTQPTIIQPKEGSWDTIRAVVEGLLKTDRPDKNGHDQPDWFYSWCQISYLALRDGRPGRRRPGHAMLIAGPGGSGKSFLQNHIVTPVLGGREADATQFLFGKDDFNGDVAGAEHLVLAEVPSSQKTVDRVALAEKFKQIVANPLQRMRLMRTEPWSVHPFWRLTGTLNDDADKLRSLPPITADYGDKVLIFHGKKTPMPMPTATEEQRFAFAEQISSELPAFIHWLTNEWEIPEALLTYDDGRDATRFGFREYHHPIVRDGLFDETQQAALLNLIDLATFEDKDMGRSGLKLWDLPSHEGSNAGIEGKAWHGPAAVLEAILTRSDGPFPCSLAVQFRELFKNNRLSTLLQRLHAHPSFGAGKRIEPARVAAWKGWLIGRPD